MTFEDIVDQILGRVNLQSDDAVDRVESSVNRHYKRITSQLGMETARFVVRSNSMGVGVRELNFTNIEKIDRLFDNTDPTNRRLLDERSLHEVRSLQPGSSQPTIWATQNTYGTSVTVITDTVPETAYALQAEGVSVFSDLSGTDVPVIPASFHDVLTFSVIAEELLRKEKTDLADRYQGMADKLIRELQFHLADSPTLDPRQAENGGMFGVSGGSSGGSATDDYARKSINETITGFWTFVGPITISNSGEPSIHTDTVDGADSKVMIVTAGGDTTLARSGRLLVAGNEHATTPGLAAVQAGNVAGAVAALSRSDGAHSVSVAGATGVVTLTHGQLKFPAVQAASTDVNTLDDYEEGDWTPTLIGSGGSSGQVYSSQIGRYVKVGKRVTAWGRITLSTLGTVTTSAQINGLPFAAQNSLPQAGTISYWGNMTSSFVVMSAYVDANTQHATIVGATAAATGLTALVQGNFSNTSDLMFSFTYEAGA